MDEDRTILERLLALFKREEAPESLSGIISEIDDLVETGKKQGLFSEEDRKMIERILTLRDTSALDIMVPRSSMVCVSAEATPRALIDLIVEKGHSRIPVYKDDFDHIIGIIHAKDILRFWDRKEEDIHITDILRTPYFIPETKPVEELLKELKARKTHLAIVIDEYGGTAGLITIEDILEEIVGEIQDEYDVPEGSFEQTGTDTISVPAATDIEKIEQYFNVEMPEGRFQSVGGFIINLIGRLPSAGEVIDFGPLRMEIEAASERRIKRVRIRKTGQQAESPDNP